MKTSERRAPYIISLLLSLSVWLIYTYPNSWGTIHAYNSWVGVLVCLFFLDGINEEVQTYWLAAVPVVVVGASLGAFFCSRMHHLHIRYLLIALIFIELLSI
ncbi:MAG: hypothetical protein RQ733_12770 [Methyloprofundus sp.]|nr:hypothetical protein [Methyloprofundus sp.]MDT8426833.1 hypothetical protein [Methyloprofundus sp.]